MKEIFWRESMILKVCWKQSPWNMKRFSWSIRSDNLDSLCRKNKLRTGRYIHKDSDHDHDKDKWDCEDELYFHDHLAGLAFED